MAKLQTGLLFLPKACFRILLGQDGIGYRPLDSKEWIIPPYPCLIPWTIIVGAFVVEMCDVTCDDKAMSEIGWNP